MSYIAVLVESPAKCGSIEKYLGQGYKCMATFGHIRELNNLNNIDIENNFSPQFLEVLSKSNHITKLRRFINGAKEVLLAADDDREGEAIAWHVCDTFGLPVATTKRIIFHEITKPALQRAVQTPTIINMNLVRAQQARQILDLLVGFKLSPILWNKISYNTKKSLSAGRCQTPALRIIYENQKEIDESPGRKVYNTTGYFTSMNLLFQLDHNHEGEEQIEEFLTESVEHEHMYECGKVRKTTKNPPTPFTTSALQQSASNELRLSPKATMESCQKLYEAGYITYMRTDSTTFSAEFLTQAKEFIANTYGSEFIREDIDSLSERKDDKKKKKKGKGKKAEEESTAQEAHEAIRPTMIERIELENMENREIRLYNLIRRNTLESCMSPAKYDAITAKITAPEEHTYKYSTEQVVFAGWKIVAGYEEQNEAFHFLKTLKPQILSYRKITSKVTMKDLKSHYTEAKLVQLLEQKGIGRPSTFSSLIDKIQERGYVKKEDIKGKSLDCTDYELEGEELSEITTNREFGGERGKLVIQPVGTLVIEFLLKHFQTLFEYNYTKSMEDTLDTIAKGEFIWHELCRSCLNEINTLSEPLGTVEKQTIVIDKYHTYMIAKYGPVIKHTKGEKVTFKKVREDLDIEKLKRGEYKLDEIIITKTAANSGKQLGSINDKMVTLYNGKYGKYVTYNDDKISITIDKPYDEIELSDVEATINSTPKIRRFSADASIRIGKFGHYIYYKTNVMKKPRFLHLNGFDDDCMTCPINKIIEWVKTTHKVQL